MATGSMMSKIGKNTSVFAIFDNRYEIERASEALFSAGFRKEDISVLFPESKGPQDFAHEKASKAPEGASAGAATGSIIGGALGWLVGMGTLAIPGVGPLIAAGPIMAALAGVGVGGALGSFTGALVGMGMPEYEAKRYEGMVKGGGILLSVHCDNAEWSKKAKDLLKSCNGQNIASSSEASTKKETKLTENYTNPERPPFDNDLVM